MIDLELTVVAGPALRWNGTAVSVPEHLQVWLARQPVGTVLRGQCTYTSQGLTLERSTEVVAEVSPDDADSALTVLGTQGLYDDLLAATAHRDDPTALAFRARALIEQRQLQRGFDVLREALRHGGPSCELDAWHSPWLMWFDREGHEKLSLISRQLMTPLFRWAEHATERTRIAGLNTVLEPELLPIFAAQQPRPKGPWHAGGTATHTVDLKVFVRRLLASLREHFDEPNFAREALLVEAVLQGDEAGQAALLAPPCNDSMQALGVLASALTDASVTLADLAGALQKVKWLNGHFGQLTQALEVAELALLLPADQLAQVRRVVFRGFVSLRAAPVLVVAALDDGHCLTALKRRGVAVTVGSADDALAAVPEIYFELALEALQRQK